MCGICGLYGPQSHDDLGRTVQRMTQTIAHRGPDGEGTFVGEGVALGHRRLSIIDLSSTGAQPMTLGASTVAYNGEAYNFPMAAERTPGSRARISRALGYRGAASCI